MALRKPLVQIGGELGELPAGDILNVGPWITSFVPTITTSVGSITSLAYNVSRYIQIGKVVIYLSNFAISTNGTGAGEIRLTLPVPMNGTFYNGAGFDGTNLKLLGVYIPAAAYMALTLYDGTYPGVNGHSYTSTIVYEAA